MDGVTRGIAADQLARLRLMLSALSVADRVEELAALPGWRLHALKGDRKGFWSLSVSGNWRLVFRWFDGAAEEIDLVDYH